LPLVAIQNQDIRINLQLKNFNSLWVSNDMENADEILNKDITFDQISLLVDYIFLDEDERRYFAQNKHYYLIEQIQLSTQSIDITRTENVIDLPFNHPVKELIWVVQTNEVKSKNQWTNYSGDIITLDEEPRPPIKEVVIRFEGVERFETRTEEYFRIVLPWKYHTSVTKNYIYIYSFANEPEKLQPTGTANFSRLDSVNLHIKTFDYLKQSDISVYAVNYNILRIINGIAGVLFTN
jgi:hypothetical protein